MILSFYLHIIHVNVIYIGMYTIKRLHTQYTRNILKKKTFNPIRREKKNKQLYCLDSRRNNIREVFISNV